jgi:murein DD-endopeptidase MepM/ murein hydrolase activator NlpD
LRAESPTQSLKKAFNATLRIFDPGKSRKEDDKKSSKKVKNVKPLVKTVVIPVDPMDMDVEEVSIDNDTVIASLSKSVTILEYYKRDTLYNGVKIPATRYYPIWNNLRMDPYEIRIPEVVKDTILINMDGYQAPCKGYVTSNYGMRWRRFHYGIDLKVQIGEPVVSSFDGVVRIAMRGKAYGNYIVVRHPNGLETTYAHLSKILVDINTPVKAGQVLAYGGSTGRSTGPHLHYEIRFLGRPLNPNIFVDFESITPTLEEVAVTQNTFNVQLTSMPVAPHKDRKWIVKRGQTLSTISRKTGVSVKKLIQLNKLPRSGAVRAGKVLKY